jgi:hypothetical protein
MACAGWGLHGVVLAIIVAWSCSLWSVRLEGCDGPPGAEGQALFARALGDAPPLDALRGFWSRGFGFVEGFVAERDGSRGDARSVRITRAGWPLLCLEGEQHYDDEKETRLDGAIATDGLSMLQPATRRPLPLRPLPGPLAVNAALLATASWGLMLLPGAIRGRWRRAGGRCTACGYDRRASGDRCPECGLEVARSSNRVFGRQAPR